MRAMEVKLKRVDWGGGGGEDGGVSASYCDFTYIQTYIHSTCVWVGGWGCLPTVIPRLYIINHAPELVQQREDAVDRHVRRGRHQHAQRGRGRLLLLVLWVPGGLGELLL